MPNTQITHCPIGALVPTGQRCLQAAYARSDLMVCRHG